MEDHSYIATRGERDRDEKSWVLKLNEGAQGPMNQRPDFVEAKREMKRLHDEHVKETSEGNTPIHFVQRSRQRRSHQFEVLEENNYQIDAKSGEPVLRSHGETCRRIQHIRQRCFFACRKVLAIDGGCRQIHLTCTVTDHTAQDDVNTTPQMNRVRGAEVCSLCPRERIDDHNIQFGNKHKSGLKVRIQYWYVMLAW